MRNLNKQIKNYIMNQLTHSAYFYNFCLARYHNNRAKELAACICSFVRRKTSITSQIFADYSDGCSYDRDSLVKKLMNFDVISFDVFDTLLFRKVIKPTDVFQLVERDASSQGYAKKRQEAEFNARKLKYQRTGSNEVTLQEIYQTPPLNSMSDVQELLCAELRTEHKVCYANEILRMLVNELKAKEKRIIAVSDMYLPQSEICTLLQENNFHGIEYVYVSCEYDASKSDGNLFELVKKDIGIEKTICHIGDNFYSDVMAQKGKIEKALHYMKNEQKKA